MRTMTAELPHILASGSPRRAELLRACQIPFVVETRDYDEGPIMDRLRASGAFRFRSKLRAALTAMVRGKGGPAPADRWVLSFDTLVWRPGRIFGKPSDGSDAMAMLRELSGGRHWVTTACRAARGDREILHQETTEVHFRILEEPVIRSAWAVDPMLDAAGAYKVQGPGLAFVDRLAGDYHNVVGLPLPFLSRIARGLS